MKALAMSFKLVIDDNKRLCAEIEIVYEDGTTVFRKVPANSRAVIHFDEVKPCASDSTAPRP